MQGVVSVSLIVMVCEHAILLGACRSLARVEFSSSRLALLRGSATSFPVPKLHTSATQSLALFGSSVLSIEIS